MTKTNRQAGVFSAAGQSLSGKVLLLTIVFVLLGEVLIFLPSIANFRIQWLKARIAQAEIAALAAEAAPDSGLDDALRSEILKGAGVVAVSLKRGATRKLMIRNLEDDVVQQTFDLRTGLYVSTLPEALSALVRGGDRLIGVIDRPPNMSGEMIEVALHEAPMIAAMRNYGFNILILSVVLSLIVAAMIYAALNRTLVRPMKRLAANMMAFAQAPEDTSRVIQPTARADEIGAAERELHDMQQQLQTMLHQKSRLAALGLAVSKVSHDLRNMLTSAQLISDRLGEVKDPNVQRFAPRLIASLDRAISFLNQTLKFGQAHELPPQRQILNLREATSDVLKSFELACQNRIALVNDVAGHVVVDADREQLSRILTNLVRNAIQAIDGSEEQSPEGSARITISAARRGSITRVLVADTGPGIPSSVRDRVFQAFQSAAKAGGTGLGLAISAELAAAHGGSIEVDSTGESGTTFVVTIPDSPVSLETHRQRAVSA